MNTQLINKVRSLNNHYKAVEAIVKYETEYFTPIQTNPADLFKVDGSLKKKYKHERLEYKKEENGFHILSTYYLKLSHSGEHLLVNIRTCTSGGSYEDRTYTCIYEESTVEIGKEYNSILLSVEDIEKQLEAVEKAKQEYKKVADAIPYEIRECLRIKSIY